MGFHFPSNYLEQHKDRESHQAPTRTSLLALKSAGKIIEQEARDDIH